MAQQTSSKSGSSAHVQFHRNAAARIERTKDAAEKAGHPLALVIGYARMQACHDDAVARIEAGQRWCGFEGCAGVQQVERSNS